MKRIFFTVIVVLFYGVCIAQNFSYSNYIKNVIAPRCARWDKDLIKQLQVGDTIPSFVLKDVKNWGSKDLALNKLKAKLTIIDFWGVNCSGCIAHIPNMNNLQKEFGNKIQIVMVTRDTKEAIHYCLYGSRILKDNVLPMYNDDAILFKYFYYAGLPVHVWIDSNRVIKSINDGESTTSANIKDYFTGAKIIKNEVKREKRYADFDDTKPIFMQGNGRYYNLTKYYSVITDATGGTDRIKFPVYQKDFEHIDSIFIDNREPWFVFRTLLEMEIRKAAKPQFNNPIYFDNRSIIPAKDSLFFCKYCAVGPETPVFSYEIKVPQRLNNRTLEFMRADLERYFRVTMVIEDRPVNCLVIYDAAQPNANPLEIPDSILVGNKINGFQTVKIKEHDNVSQRDVSKKMIYRYNATISEIIGGLPSRASDPIFIDGTGDEKKRYNVIFHMKDEKYELPIDRARIIPDLEKAGFVLKKEIRTIPMIVAKDIN